MERHDEEGGGREAVSVGGEGRGGGEFTDLRHLSDSGIAKRIVVVLSQRAGYKIRLSLRGFAG